jgi:putative hydrolase of the HAD superfamily
MSDKPKLSNLPAFIYFDLDDTLLDHSYAEKMALLDVYDEYAEFRQTESEAWVNTYHSVNKNLWFRYGKGEIDRKELHRARFEDTMKKLELDSARFQTIGKTYMQRYRDHWQWVDGAFDAFREIREKYPVGLITNGFAETQKEKIRRFELEDLSHVIISEDYGVMKPHPLIFNVATEMAEKERGEILYVGDSWVSDIEGGRTAGWQTAWYTARVEEIKPGADLTFNSFDELLKAVKR